MKCAMSKGAKQTRCKRRPSLSDALKAAMKAGLKVRSAVQEEGRVVLTFDDGTSASTNNENEWGRRLKDLGYGKS